MEINREGIQVTYCKALTSHPRRPLSTATLVETIAKHYNVGKYDYKALTSTGYLVSSGRPECSARIFNHLLHWCTSIAMIKFFTTKANWRIRCNIQISPGMIITKINLLGSVQYMAKERYVLSLKDKDSLTPKEQHHANHPEELFQDARKVGNCINCLLPAVAGTNCHCCLEEQLDTFPCKLWAILLFCPKQGTKLKCLNPHPLTIA